MHTTQLPHDDPESVQGWRDLFEVNVFAPVSLIQEFHDLLLESKGRIVNVGSVAGEITTAGNGQYSASKHALRSANDAMRPVYAKAGVSVSLVEPGYVRSQMCDPKKRGFCDHLGPEETTTPAYVDALTSPRPKSNYVVAHLGGGWSANVWTPVIRSLPTRLFDRITSAIGPKPRAKN